MAAIKEYETAWQMQLIRLAYFVSLSSMFLTNHSHEQGEVAQFVEVHWKKQGFPKKLQFTQLDPTMGIKAIPTW